MVALIAILPALLVSSSLLHETPLSYDHATHLFKGWHFWEEMLGRGRLRGWSHFWAFGFPSGELVPIGSEAWVALFRAFTFGQLSWLHTYALSFAGLLIFKTFAAYAFARCFVGRAAAVACAWITLYDPGGMLEGGWTWHTYWGVWPVTLAMSFAQLSLARVVHVLEGGSRRDVLAAGAWLGAALLTHQMALPAFVLAVPLLVVDYALRPGALSWAKVVRVAAALATGLGFSAFFLIPFLARGEHTQDLGWLGESLPDVSQQFVELRTFQNVWVPVHALALLGAWGALRRRISGGFVLVVTGGVLVVLASGTLLRDLHLERVLPTLIKLEANRFLLLAKLFWFPLAGYGIVLLLSPLVSFARRSSFGWREATKLAIGGALTGALLLPGFPAFREVQLDKDIVGEGERKFWKDFPALLEWTRELRRTSREHYRIAYDMWRGDHLSTISPVFDGTLMYKIGYTPTQIFNKIPTTNETELLEALSVKYVVSESRLDRPTLKLERRFGQLWVYRFNRYRPEPFHIIGSGKGDLLEFSPERIRIQLSETTPGSRLVFHVAQFDRWQATSAGRVVPITTAPVLSAEYPMLMEVTPGNGELVLEYVYRAVDWLGLIATLGTLPAFFAAYWLDRRYATFDWLCSLLSRFSRGLAWSGGVVALIAVVWIALGTRSRARLLPATSIFQRLEAPEEMSLAGEPCQKTAALSFRCGAERVRADVVAGVWGLHRCIAAPGDGPLDVRLQTTLGSFLAGHYDPRAEGAGQIRVSVDGQELGSVATRPSFLRHQSVQFDTRSRRGESALLKVTLTGAALHCFDLAVIE